MLDEFCDACLESLPSHDRLRIQMLPRTQRQKEVLDYISRFLAKHGHEPSYAQIARNFGVKSKATTAKHISALERRGLIKREHEPGRFTLAVRFEESSPDAVCEVALLGRIAAGAPIDAVGDIEMICVPRFLLGRVRQCDPAAQLRKLHPAKILRTSPP